MTRQIAGTRQSLGFTIVELVVVIVVIAILAAITVVVYNGVTNDAREASMMNDLKNNASNLSVIRMQTGAFPANQGDANLKVSGDNQLSYTGSAKTFCMQATNPKLKKSFYITESAKIKEGACPSYLQTVTSANCPSDRTMAIDARDNKTYWIQHTSDGNCWMLTNLAYAGGGVDTYGDVKTIHHSTTGTSYTEPRYYTPSGANPTVNPNAPSTSTDGTGQYGYLYNYCAARGGQVGTDSCSSVNTTNTDPTISICPAGWRLATHAEIDNINVIANWSSDTLRSIWLFQYGGSWGGSFQDQGSSGNVWYADHSAPYAQFHNISMSGIGGGSSRIYNGYSVRCVTV